MGPFDRNFSGVFFIRHTVTVTARVPGKVKEKKKGRRVFQWRIVTGKERSLLVVFRYRALIGKYPRCSTKFSGSDKKQNIYALFFLLLLKKKSSGV